MFSAGLQHICSRAFRCLAAAVLVLACATAHAKDQVPDWVRAAAAQATPDVPKNTDAVVLLEETTYTVVSDGTLTHHVRKVIRILRPQGRRFGELYAHFNGTAKLRYLHIWSIGPDGKEYAVKDNELTEVGTGAGFELYSDDRARGGKAPAWMSEPLQQSSTNGRCARMKTTSSGYPAKTSLFSRSA